MDGVPVGHIAIGITIEKMQVSMPGIKFMFRLNVSSIKGSIHLFKIWGCMAVTRKPCPDLRNEYAPYLSFRCSTLSLSLLLQIKHALAQRNKVG